MTERRQRTATESLLTVAFGVALTASVTVVHEPVPVGERWIT